MSKRNNKTPARTEATSRLRETQPDKFVRLQTRCMDTFTKQMQKTVESVQTARFRFIGEWWNYWYYDLWRIDPSSQVKSGFQNMKEALDAYGMEERTFHNYRNEASAILKAVHGGVIPDDAVFTSELAVWAYNASKQARMISSRGDIKLLPLLPNSVGEDEPELPSIVGDNLRQYYLEKKIAREEKRAAAAANDLAAPRAKRGTVRYELDKMHAAVSSMRLIWKQRVELTAEDERELAYLIKMILLYNGADTYNPENKEDREMTDISYHQAIQISADEGVDMLRDHNRFSYTALFPRDTKNGKS